MTEMAHHLGPNLCNLDGAWIPAFQGQCGHGKLHLLGELVSLEPLKADSPSSHKGMGLDLVGQNCPLGNS